MGQHEMGHAQDKAGHAQDKTGATGKRPTHATDDSTARAERGGQRPQAPDEASKSDKEAMRSPPPGEKFHGDKLQNTTTRKP